jgi:CBS-domain-containing membrane protein
MNNIRQMLVSDLVDTHALTVRPDAGLVDALMVISERQYVVPVVDEDRKLVGAISYFSIMHAVESEMKAGTK